MAGEWIAMRHDLWECPQVVRILSAMCPQNVRDISTRCRIIGALYRTWCIFDRYTEDGKLVGYTANVLNEEIGIEGWSENLQHVGWLVIDEQSLTVPDFMEYFGDSAKRRMKDRRRKAESRKPCPQSVRKPADVLRTTEQNRTEQKNKKHPVSLFVEPTLEEVTAYVIEKGYVVDPQQWIDHYTANGWLVGRNPMKDWRAAVRTWAKNEFGGNNKPSASRSQDESLAEAKRRIARTRKEYIDSCKEKP